MATEYDRDEFDEIADRGGPVGVHRAPRRWWHTVIPPVLIFLLAGAAAFGIATFFWNRDNGAAAEPEPSFVESPQPSPSVTLSPSPSPSATPSPTPTQTTPPAPVIEYDTAVAVLNGSGISGLAAKNQGTLEDAGFTDVTAGNLASGDRPSANVVMYESADLEDTARAAADSLGISTIEQGSTPGGDPIEVLLVSDPEG